MRILRPFTQLTAKAAISRAASMTLVLGPIERNRIFEGILGDFGIDNIQILINSAADEFCKNKQYAWLSLLCERLGDEGLYERIAKLGAKHGDYQLIKMATGSYPQTNTFWTTAIYYGHIRTFKLCYFLGADRDPPHDLEIIANMEKHHVDERREHSDIRYVAAARYIFKKYHGGATFITFDQVLQNKFRKWFVTSQSMC